MKTKSITVQQLHNLLSEIDGQRPTFVSMVTVTDARLKKKDNPYTEVKKVTRLNGLINFNYSNSVNNQLQREQKETTFKAQPRKYGIKFDDHNGCLVYGANDIKLVVKPDQQSRREKFVLLANQESADVKQRSSIKLIDLHKIKQFIPDKSANPKANQGTDKEITYRNYDLSSIKRITINKQRYR